MGKTEADRYAETVAEFLAREAVFKARGEPLEEQEEHGRAQTLLIAECLYISMDVHKVARDLHLDVGRDDRSPLDGPSDGLPLPRRRLTIVTGDG